MNYATKIMIIDDSYTNRIFFKAILEELDIQVIEAHCASQALEVLNSVTPDIILLDMCMPIMNGIEFLQKFRLRQNKTPVIVVSVLDEQTQIQKALRAGASDYLIKPVEPENLVKCIAQYVNCEILY
jgi:CheY-like chemotaxis protein